MINRSRLMSPTGILCNPNLQTIMMYNPAEDDDDDLPLRDKPKSFFTGFCDSVAGKPCPSAPVIFLNHLTAAKQGIHSISLSNL